MQKKPNIVFILIDDMGWRDLSCYGSKFYETPNIDRLIVQGMHFTNAYAACPVCSPTRASILTGKYPATLGLTYFLGGSQLKGYLIDAPYIDHLPLTEKSLASSLKESGYNTWHIGKWHLGKSPYYPQNHGFDINIGGCHLGMPPRGYFSPWDIENLSNGKDGQHLTDRLTDEAIKLIKDSGDKPFFLNLCYYSVHTPIQAKKSYVKKYRQKVKDMGLDKLETFEIGQFYPTKSRSAGRIFRRLLQSDPVYAAMIEILDENIGRLMDAIEEKGKSEDTIVIFTSDNGGLNTSEDSPTSNLPLSEGKGWMYEGGVRVPLIVRWPDRIGPGSVCHTPVTSPDFYPTLLQVAGLSLMPEQHSDGKSLMPLLLGDNRLDRDAIFWHFPHYGNQGGTPGSSVRVGDYKLIEFYEDNRLELYDLKEDISEKDNIANGNLEIVDKMHKRLTDWRKSIYAKIPQPNPEWRGLNEEKC